MTRNFGQRRCRYCGKWGGDYGVHSQPCISVEERQALIAFREENGIRWRSKLRDSWTRGEPILQELRNVVGPSGLDRILKK